MLMFLYFENFMFFLVFLNYLKICLTTRAVGRTLQEKKIIFGIFDNECHTVRAIR